MSFLLFKSITGLIYCQHPLGSLFLATQLLFMSHAVVEVPTLEESGKDELLLSVVISEVPKIKLPYTDTTNFDNSNDSLFMSKKDYEDLNLTETYPYYKNRETTKLVLHGRINFSDSVRGILFKNYMSEYEMESRLITYKRGVYKASCLLAYDEIAESAFRTTSTITDSTITVTSYNYLEDPPKITKETSVITADGDIVGK